MRLGHERQRLVHRAHQEARHLRAVHETAQEARRHGAEVAQIAAREDGDASKPNMRHLIRMYVRCISIYMCVLDAIYLYVLLNMFVLSEMRRMTQGMSISARGTLVVHPASHAPHVPQLQGLQQLIHQLRADRLLHLRVLERKR